MTSAQVAGRGRVQPATAPAAASPDAAKRDLKAEALSSSGVQAMLDVFPAEIRDVEELHVTDRRPRPMNILEVMQQAKQMQEQLQKRWPICASRPPPAAAW